MMNRAQATALLLVICALIDQFISLCFPIDFTFSSLSFIPMLTFMACMLVTYDLKLLNRILVGAMIGLINGMFFGSGIVYKLILYALFALIGGYLKDQIEDNYVLLGLVIVFSSFLYELIIILFSKLFGLMTMLIISYLVHVEIISIIGRSLFISIMIYIKLIYDRYALISQSRQRKLERKKFYNLKKSGNE